MGGVTYSLDSGIHYTLFRHTFDLLDRERKNSAKISPLEGVADVMFKRGTGFISSLKQQNEKLKTIENKLEKTKKEECPICYKPVPIDRKSTFHAVIELVWKPTKFKSFQKNSNSNRAFY